MVQKGRTKKKTSVKRDKVRKIGNQKTLRWVEKGTATKNQEGKGGAAERKKEKEWARGAGRGGGEVRGKTAQRESKKKNREAVLERGEGDLLRRLKKGNSCHHGRYKKEGEDAGAVGEREWIPPKGKRSRGGTEFRSAENSKCLKKKKTPLLPVSRGRRPIKERPTPPPPP